MTAMQPVPATVLADPEGPKAGFGERLVAQFIDFVVLSVVAIPLAIVGSWASFLLWAAYYVAMEGGSGQTVGKRLVGLRVVDEDTGASIGRPRALVRHLGRIISFMALGLGYLWVLWDPRKQTWHDKMARAVVVRGRAPSRQSR